MHTEETNFRANIGDGAFYIAGSAFVAAQTILPVFVQRLGGSNLIIGLTPGLLTAAWLLPQLAAANRAQQLTLKKPYIARLGLVQRIVWLALAGLTLLLPENYLLGAFLLLYVTGGLAGGLAGPAWVDLISRITRVERRGSLFAWRLFLGNGMGFLAAWVSRWVLANTPFPQNYASLFLLAFIFLSISLRFFLKIEETPTPILAQPVKLNNYLRQLPALLRANTNFLWFLIANALITMGTMATAFYTVAGIGRFDLPREAAASFTMALTAGQLLGALFCGRLADRLGHRINLLIFTFLGLVATLLALWSPSLASLYLLFFLLGVSFTAQLISQQSFIVELGTPQECPTYVGIANTWFGPFTLLAPVLGGLIADNLGYPPLFLVAAIFLCLGGILLYVKVQEPRTQWRRLASESGQER